ncbi:hypothetical protein, partial [Pseudomonas proteolytica]|uniref:hypothetical protein n=1 Tax=Pseudomonas proteolytica TaxID=219574 RepID=UPI001CA41BFF
PVASGLAPRWAAKQPQNQPLRCIWYNAFGLLGLLRSPARAMRRSDKPARHNCAICLDLGVAAKLCRYLCSDEAPKTYAALDDAIAVQTGSYRGVDSF